MPLWDNLPHTMNVYTSTNAVDSAGGHTTTYTLSQTAVPCSINPAGSSNRPNSDAEGMFGQTQIMHNAAIATLTANLDPEVKRGDKVVGSDGYTYKIEGISYGLAYGNVPAFTYLTVVATL